MVNYTDSAWAGRQDTHNRSHVPVQPLWHFILRIAQLVLALLVLILTAYSAGQFGSGDLAGFGLAWFTFILTVGYLVWLGVSIFINPSVYNYWAQLALEIACVIFWLCTWAVLASEAADFAVFDGYFDYYGLKSAIDCVKASAGIGALVWVLFVVTLVFFVLSLLHHRKSQAPAAGGINMHETKHDGTTAAAAPVDQSAAYPQAQQAYQQQPAEAYPQAQQAYQQQPADTYPQQPAEAYQQPQQAYAVPAEHHSEAQQPQQQAYAVPAHQQV